VSVIYLSIIRLLDFDTLHSVVLPLFLIIPSSEPNQAQLQLILLLITALAMGFPLESCLVRQSSQCNTLSSFVNVTVLPAAQKLAPNNDITGKTVSPLWLHFDLFL
jgi:hypothetical protein